MRALWRASMDGILTISGLLKSQEIQNITVHPQQKRHGDLGEKLEINRYLHNHISHEGPRLGNMKLILPIEWKDEKEAPRPTVLRLPADYESCLSVNEEPKKQAKPFKPMAESQSPEPYQRDESDLQAPDPDKIDNRYTLEETHEGSKEMEELTKKFPLPPHAQGNEKERRDIAIKLSRIVDERNSQYQKHRSLVVLMAALKPLEDDRKLVTSLKWHTREEIEEDDKIRCCGAITFSENDLDDPERYPTEIVAKFLTFKGTKEAFSEGKVEKTIGALLNGVIAGEGAIDRDNSPLYFQDHLKVFGSNPSPDLYVRALGEAFAGGPESWHPWLLPIIFAAECKPQKGYQKEQANAQLAVAFQATMIILILYYLDSRPSATAAIPPWMFLYGIQYTENGLLIRAHCPWYKHDSEKPEWQFRSVLVTQAYNNVFQKKDEALLLRLLAALLKIRSHSWYVLKQLQAWKRGTSVLQPLREFAKAKKVAT
ncbi:hypothetical protein CPB86DRAFT_298149 [Serendipita vermifera]|nr:hypothetical protein CPB86DRAFT_298149 [Serendipita vermifera]